MGVLREGAKSNISFPVFPVLCSTVAANLLKEVKVSNLFSLQKDGKKIRLAFKTASKSGAEDSSLSEVRQPQLLMVFQ